MVVRYEIIVDPFAQQQLFQIPHGIVVSVLNFVVYVPPLVHLVIAKINKPVSQKTVLTEKQNRTCQNK